MRANVGAQPRRATRSAAREGEPRRNAPKANPSAGATGWAERSWLDAGLRPGGEGEARKNEGVRRGGRGEARKREVVWLGLFLDVDLDVSETKGALVLSGRMEVLSRISLQRF